MTASTEENDEIQQYLLGTLSQAARQRVEERLLTEEDFFEDVLVGEDELIDQYLNGALSDENRDAFEQRFLSTPERQQKLRFGGALSRYVARNSENAADEFSERQQLLIAASAPSIGPTTWAGQFHAFWRSQTWGLRATLSLALIAIIVSAALWLSRTTPSPRTFATLALTISANNRAEGVQAKKVSLPLNADALRVSLTLPDQPPLAAGRYRVELVNDSGETKPLEIAGQDARSVSVAIPAAQLTRGQYALKLFTSNAGGTEQRINGSYFFTVE
ncbi:MAG: hypothetical protein M3371_14860 [Acidobacteriota bacterium]|nr:hypothetical protein [Acidobacteriota bacterium]